MVPKQCITSVRQYFVALANGNLAAAADGLDPTAAAEFKTDFIRFRAALPDYQFSVAQVIVQPARIIVHWTAHGQSPAAAHTGAGGDQEAAEAEVVPGLLAYRVTAGPSVDEQRVRDRQVFQPHRVGWATVERVAA
jgi:hypothetical protein